MCVTVMKVVRHAGVDSRMIILDDQARQLMTRHFQLSLQCNISLMSHLLACLIVQNNHPTSLCHYSERDVVLCFSMCLCLSVSCARGRGWERERERRVFSGYLCVCMLTIHETVYCMCIFMRFLCVYSFT